SDSRPTRSRAPSARCPPCRATRWERSRSPRWRSSSALECQGAVKIGRILLWGPRRPGMFALLRERSRPPVACRQRSPTLPTSEATMTSIRHAPVRAVLVLTLCGSYAAAAQDSRAALDPITSAVINHPITTSSAAARAHLLEGLRELDLRRVIDANAPVKAADAPDPDFAFA